MEEKGEVEMEEEEEEEEEAPPEHEGHQIDQHQAKVLRDVGHVFPRAGDRGVGKER